MNKYSCGAVALMLCVSTSSCYKSYDGNQDSKDLQSVRADVIRNFVRDPNMAASRYKELFLNEDSQEDARLTAEKLAAAGELLEADSKTEGRYRAYILRKLRDENDQIRSLAVAALKGARDDATRELLFERLRDPAEIVRIEAVGAIEYRRDTAVAETNSRERDVILAAISKYCEGDELFGHARHRLCD